MDYLGDMAEIDEYVSGIDFLKKEVKYDVVFLDIKLGDINGIELAKENNLSRKSKVCFVTSHLEYSRAGYLINAFRFIDKACLKEELIEAIEAILYQKERCKRTQVIRLKNVALAENDIFYIEKEGRRLIIHTLNEEYMCNRTLDAMEEELSSNIFFRAHKSCLVNLTKIKEVKTEDILLQNGEKAFCSVRKRKKLIEKWIVYKKRTT